MVHLPFAPTVSFLLLGALALPGVAGENEPAQALDKSGYHLFNPTPREQMRELTTDRPDKTESPITVDAGHFQVEMDLATFTRDRHNPERADVHVETWSFANTNFKVGLLNNLDLQVVVPIYTQVRTDDRVARAVTRNQGFGDMVVRLKMNFWGNDGGATAGGMIPFLKIPTNQDDLGNDAVEGGLILPLAVSLPGGWDMGIMTEVDFNRNGDNSRYHAEWTNSVTFSHAIVGELSGYVEFFSTVSGEKGAPWVGTVDCGLTYGLTKDIQLDVGTNFGVTRAADDLNAFAGLSWRF